MRAYRTVQEHVEEAKKNGTKTALMRAEESARTAITDLLREFLPEDYVLGPGIITDSRGTFSSNFDLVIRQPALIDLGFPDRNGIPVIAYEDVYAVGDIKVLAMPQYLMSLAQKLEHLSTNLHRKNTPADFMFDAGPIHLMSADNPPSTMYRNPLFSMFVSFFKNPLEFPNLETGQGDWSGFEFLSQFYEAAPAVPTITAMLDSATVIPAQLQIDEQGEVLAIGHLQTPSWLQERDEDDDEYRHEWLLWASKTGAPLANFATLVSALSDHLRKCVLRPADIEDYFGFQDVIEGFDLIAPISTES